jgi:hypothetical protein
MVLKWSHGHSEQPDPPAPRRPGPQPRFYRDVLGLAVYREFGPPDDPAVVFFLGPRLLKVSELAAGPPGRSVMIWIQVRDVHAESAPASGAYLSLVHKPNRSCLLADSERRRYWHLRSAHNHAQRAARAHTKKGGSYDDNHDHWA